MQPQPTAHEIARKAMTVFHNNIDTLVAGFLIRNPDINPGDVVLVHQQTSDGIRFYVDAKELHVPVPKEVDTGSQRENDFARGWNACRQAMIGAGEAKRASLDVHSIGGANG